MEELRAVLKEAVACVAGGRDAVVEAVMGDEDEVNSKNVGEVVRELVEGENR